MFFSELFLQTVNIIIIAKQPVLIQLKVYHSYNKKIITGLFLRPVNILIITKQPVSIPLKVYHYSHFTPRGRQNKTFSFVNFHLFGSISYYNRAE